MQDKEAVRRISRNLTRILRERGMSQRALARATNEPVMNVSRLVRGLNEPGVGILTRIADVLQVTLDDLLSLPPKGPQKNSA